MAGDLAIHQPGVRLFDVEGTPLRFGVTNDGRAYAVAADLAKRFDYTSAKDALRLLDEEEKGRQILPTPGGPQEMLVVYEDGILELIFRSGKPEARRFKKRVKEIIKEICETGSYNAPAVPDMSTAEGRLQILDMAVRAERRALESEQRIRELEPDAARARKTMDAYGLALVGTAAKRFGIKVTALRAFMYDEKLLIKGGARHNEAYAKLCQSGHFEIKWTEVETDPDGPPIMKGTTYVTPKGEALIWKRLFEAGLVRSPEMPSQQLALIAA